MAAGVRSPWRPFRLGQSDFLHRTVPVLSTEGDVLRSSPYERAVGTWGLRQQTVERERVELPAAPASTA
jgi:hypothetical protein